MISNWLFFDFFHRGGVWGIFKLSSDEWRGVHTIFFFNISILVDIVDLLNVLPHFPRRFVFCFFFNRFELVNTNLNVVKMLELVLMGTWRRPSAVQNVSLRNVSQEKKNPIYPPKYYNFMSVYIQLVIVPFSLRKEVPVDWSCRTADSIFNHFLIDFAAFLVTLWGLTILWISSAYSLCSRVRWLKHSILVLRYVCNCEFRYQNTCSFSSLYTVQFFPNASKCPFWLKNGID